MSDRHVNVKYMFDIDFRACFANARTREERERDRDGGPVDRGRVTVYEPEDCDELVRQHLEQAPRCTGPTLIPIQV